MSIRIFAEHKSYASGNKSKHPDGISGKRPYRRGTIVEDAPWENRIAVRSAYEWHDDSGHWYRSYGNENWEFDEDGLMRERIASINDVPIKDGDRKYHWKLGRRPDGHPSLSDLGL